MNFEKTFENLLRAEKADQVAQILDQLRTRFGSELTEKPFGGKKNNEGPIEISKDPGRSIVERVTNAIDAVLDLENLKHKGQPACKTPKQAGEAWLGVPAKKGLSGLSPSERQNLANNIIIRLEPGNEEPNSRTITIQDRGIGIQADQMEESILSLNEDNKIAKHYLAGIYGQGGSSTLSFSQFTLIASRFFRTDEISYTLIYHKELPAESFKNGRYVYLTLNNHLFTFKAGKSHLKHGTIVRHFGYDLTKYKSPIGPNSLYGVLGKVLFDPVLPFWFENKVHAWNRVIKGARNALNGAVDAGDDSKGPDLDYHVPLYNISLNSYGAIGIEYWVLTRPKKEGAKYPKNPANAFVDSTRPIILSHNGQNQEEFSSRLIHKEADKPFLRNRIICNINCDNLTPAAKRRLFASTRESAKEGHLKELITNTLIENLKHDDELIRLNEEAKNQSLKEGDAVARKEVRQQIARMLKITGAAPVMLGGEEGEDGEQTIITPKPPTPSPEPIPIIDPPTYIKILWEEGKEIPFYSSQTRYIRIETDAGSHYHDHEDLTNSPIQIVLGEDLDCVGTSPLKSGRMRVGIRCKENCEIGKTGQIVIVLKRKGLSPLKDDRKYKIIEKTTSGTPKHEIRVPEFKFIPVAGPKADNWEYLSEGEPENDVTRVASRAIMDEEGGVLLVYYSTSFPKFSYEFNRLQKSDPAKANSFKTRYEIWIAVHALLMENGEKETQAFLDNIAPEQNQIEIINEMKRQERCRYATIAAIISSKEVTEGLKIVEEDLES